MNGVNVSREVAVHEPAQGIAPLLGSASAAFGSACGSLGESTFLANLCQLIRHPL